MLKIDVNFYPDSDDSSSGQVEYTIPEFDINERFSYRLIPRRSNIESVIRLEDGHVKVEEAKFQKLIQESGVFAFQVCLDLIALPTFSLGDAKRRVAIEHDRLLNFMQKVLDLYNPEETPVKKPYRSFKQIFGLKTGKSELSCGVKCEASSLVARFQQVGVGICTRNPGVCWDCLAPTL